MKLAYKIGRQVAYALFAVGLVLVIIAIMMGASWHDANVSIVPESYTSMRGGWLRNSPAVAASSVAASPEAPEAPAAPNNGGAVYKGKINLNESYTDVTSLQFDFEAAETRIVEGDTFSIKVTGEGKEFRSKVDNGVWEIYSHAYRGYKGRNDKHYTVTITLPKTFVAERANISMGMDSLTADKLVSKKTDLNVGMGMIEIESLVSQETVLSCGMGRIDVNGDLTGSTTIDCGMGEVSLELVGSESDYGYTASVGMGTIGIGDSASLSGLGGDSSDGTDRANQLYIDCGMGMVDVDFK